MIHRIMLIWACCLLSSNLGHADEMASPDDVESLIAAAEDENMTWIKTHGKTGKSDNAIERYESWPIWQYIPLFVDIVLRDAEGDCTLRIANWLAEMTDRVGLRDTRMFRADSVVVEAIMKRCLNQDGIASLLVKYERPSKAREQLLRYCLRSEFTKDVQGVACLTLALHLKQKAGISRHPPDASSTVDVDKFGEHISSVTAPEYRSYLMSIDAEACERESRDLMKRAKSEFGNVEYPMEQFEPFGVPSISRYLDSLETGVPPIDRLAIGTMAPQISAQDLHGATVSLTDLGGRIVVLDFWASWCSPCMKGVAPLRDLINEYGEESVKIMGVNLDEDIAKARKASEIAGITWQSWSDAGGNDERISHRYHVMALPAIYVIDNDGVIRCNDAENAEDVRVAINAIIDRLGSKKTDEP